MSLFCGAGGLDHGFEKVGFRPVLAIDVNRAAIETYKRNHPNTTVRSIDLATVEPTTILDLWEDCAEGLEPIGIIGGPPCQAFSSSNVHQSENDPRRKLLDNYASIINTFATRYTIDFFVIENVPGLIQVKHRAVFCEFKEAVRNSGFEVMSDVLDAGTVERFSHQD